MLTCAHSLVPIEVMTLDFAIILDRSRATGVEDCRVGVPDAVAEGVAAQILPDAAGFSAGA
jgi:hypothetical protein